LQITILGSSAFVASAQRSWTSLLLDLGNGDRILVDAGSWRLVNSPRVLAVSKIYLTHRHIDHICFLGALLRKMRRRGRTHPLDIFLPANATHRLRPLIRIFNFRFPSFVRFHPFDVYTPRRVDQLPGSKTEVWAASADHTTATVAYSFRQEAVQVTVAPDTRSGFSPLIELARGTSVLLHDCTFSSGRLRLARRYGHSSPEGAGYDAACARARNLVLTHISDVWARNQSNLLAGAREYFSGPIILACDRLSLTLSNPKRLNITMQPLHSSDVHHTPLEDTATPALASTH